jgi:hypothetical protein
MAGQELLCPPKDQNSSSAEIICLLTDFDPVHVISALLQQGPTHPK